MNLLSDRSNRVITNFGLTESYLVKNGIDQGETITPLLWRIYYDPLIHQIAQLYKGYTMKTSWLQDLKFKKTQHIQTSASVLAYIDDTIWIASTKNELEQITNTASSFFQMANIEVNPLKSILITNSSNATPINFINQLITPHAKHIPFKFLGCWFSLSHN
jgi:hypothetical protein